MGPQELYSEGRLREAIQALGDELRKNPLDARRRTFLFELLLFAGEYARAEKQLDVLSGGGAESAAGSLLYRSALHAERTRQEMFARGETPKPQQHAAAPMIVNGRRAEEITDADPRIGPNLEVFLAGSYTWIPFGFVQRLEIETPKNLRDVMWARARLETTPEFRLQELGEVLVPGISPLSWRHAEGALQLGRETAWEEDETWGAVPFGAKLLTVDGVDVPLLQIRTMEWVWRAGETNDASS